jgi:hypothetical protein
MAIAAYHGELKLWFIMGLGFWVLVIVAFFVLSG